MNFPANHCFNIFMLMCLLCAFPAFSQNKTVPDKYTFGAIEARQIGPATMSGRISAIDAVNADPRIAYIGAASGGLWKTKNAGTTVKPVFDEYNQSIGAICIDQKSPDTVWVGTGETWVRNSVSAGDGIYRTVDGGEKWEKKGLENTERIAKIIIHPDNPNIVFVAVLGNLWNPSSERGVYKTTDGGNSWEKILFIDENTGCSDLAIDFENPDILYAGMWQFRRSPDFFNSGGPGSGLYQSTDGGKTWVRKTNDLPSGKLGRIALTVSPADKSTVWALIESEKSALYRSKDKGETWTMMNDEQVSGERPFYFSLIVADPVDTNRIYKPGYTLNVSDDGGKKFTYPFAGGGNVHSDLHALWISPADNRFLYLGTDGGVYLSHDKGNTWKFMRNLPVSQFYRVAVDDQKPYFVYGGLQDNGSWMGPSANAGGITYSDWENVGYGDGFNVVPDPGDTDLLYWQYQGGNVKRFYRKSREVKDIQPLKDEKSEDLRFNWNTPLVFSHDGKRMYTGAQYLFMTTDKGDSWTRISDDLTTDNPSKQRQAESGGLTIDNTTAENHCTIYSIAESPLNNQIIWVGTDDGNVQLTKDGGNTWQKLNIPSSGLPDGMWVSWIEPGAFDEKTAFVTLDNHRNGDMKPYVFKTEDYGATWVKITDENIAGFCHTIKQDLKNPDVLYLGTESGLFISIDGGIVWTRFTGNFPKVPVHHLVFQERENDLVIATHGRGIFILDDLTPLQNLKPELLDEELVFLDSRPYNIRYLGGKQSYNGDDEFVGSNPSGALQISYYMKKRHIFGDMYMEVYNDKGEKIKTLPTGKSKGINRVSWVMRMKPPKVPASRQLLGQAIVGPTYPPGNYTVKLIKGDKTWQHTYKVQYDEDSPHSIADRDIRQQTMMRAYDLLGELGYINRQITDFTDVAKKLAENEKLPKKIRKQISETSTQLSDLRQEMVATKKGGITGEIKLREKIGDIYGNVMDYQGRPTQTQIESLAMLEKEVDVNKQKVEKIFGEKLPVFNPELEKAGLQPIKLTTKEEFEKEN